jgi:uncharacterized protein YodC (DUF2158 family)
MPEQKSEPLREGDAVQWIHGGGPTMIVSGPPHSGKVRCEWFSKNHEFFSVEFPVSALEKHDQSGAH